MVAFQASAPLPLGPALSPGTRLVLYLGEPGARVRSATQRLIGQALGLSQATCSRVTRALRQQGVLRVYPTGDRDRYRHENLYALSPVGESRARQLWEGILPQRLRGLGLTFQELRLLLPDYPAEPLLRALPEAAVGEGADLPDLLRQLEDVVAATGGRELDAPSRFRGRYAERQEILRFLGPPEPSGPTTPVLVLLGGLGSGKTRMLEWTAQVATLMGFTVRRTTLSGNPLPALDLARELIGQGPSLSPAVPTQCCLPLLLLEGGGMPEGPYRSERVLFLVDDVDRARESHRSVLRFLVGGLSRQGGGARVVLSIRSEEGELPPPILQAIDRWVPGGVRILRLPPLGPPDAEALIADELRRSGRTIPERQIRLLFRWAKGNPLSLLEGLREARTRPRWSPTQVRSASLRLAPGQDGHSPMWDLLQARLDDLRPPDRGLLEYAALLGQTFDQAPLQHLLQTVGGNWPRDVGRSLERSARAGLLRPVGSDRWAFGNEGYREHLLRRFKPSRGACLALGKWFAEHRPDPPLLAARFLAQAGDPALALPWIQRACDRAFRENLPEEVEESVDHLRRTFPGTPEGLRIRAPLEIRAGQWLWVAGYPRASQMVLGSLLKALHEVSLAGIWARVNLASATVATDTLRAEQELRQARVESALLGAAVPPALRGALNATGAFLAYQQGRWRSSLRQAQRALRQLDGTSDWVWVTWAKVSRSAAQVHLGLFKEALEASRASRREASMPQENGRMALEWGNEARIRLAGGDLEGAGRALDRGLGVARTYGNVAVLASLLTNRILVDLRCRRWSWAYRDLNELERLTLRFELPIHTAWAIFRRAQILCAQARWEAAKDALRASRRSMTQVGQAKALPLIRAYEVLAEGETGRTEWALKELRDLGPRWASMDWEERPPLAWLRARLLVRLGLFLQGEQVLSKALREARRARNPETIGWLLREMGSLQRRRGSLAEAARAERRALCFLRQAGVYLKRCSSPWMTGPPPPGELRFPERSPYRPPETVPPLSMTRLHGPVPIG